MESQNLAIIGAVINFIIIAIVLVFVIRFYKRKKVEIKKRGLDFNDNETSVPLLASFVGIKFLPTIIAVGYNNISPKLIFFEEGIGYKVFSKSYKKYSDIELVDIWITFGTRNLTFKFRNSIFTFTANLGDDNNLKNALGFLQKKNCPLSSKAEKFLSNEKIKSP
jgi:hypothetical protein